MSETFKLINNAVETTDKQDKQNDIVKTNLTILAEQQNVSVEHLVENVTHILANLAFSVEQSKLIKVMHLRTTADFLAGVEAISAALPQSTDQSKKQNTLRILAAASIDPTGNVNSATTPIILVGARKQELRNKYLKMIQDYTDRIIHNQNVGQEDERNDRIANRQLVNTIRKLQLMIDQATRIASHSMRQNQPAAAGPSMAGSVPSHF